jgi:hypothetical protein
MKPRLLLFVLTAGLALFSSALVASANLVTYQIDMSVQTTLGNFIPGTDRVLVAGNFSTPDWIAPATTAFVLTNDPGNPNIYLGTFNNDIPNTSWENHKFIIDVGGTATTLNWELGGNRFFQVSAGDQTLPVVFFNDITNVSTIVTTQVTFSVNMGVQQALGNFNPDTDFVYVAGDPLNGWTPGASTLTNSLADTNVWINTFSITSTVGTTVNFKFIMNTFLAGQQWENNGVGPGGAQNRQFTFTNEATTLPTVYFNNITNSSSLITTQVTFKVNLAAQIAAGTFDPNIGTVSVAGDAINNWNPLSSVLAQTGTNSSLWSGTFDITNTVGAPVNYKFVLNGGGTWENNGVGPNGANDRQMIFTNLATVLPDVHFNNLDNLGALTISPPSGGQVTVNWTAGPLIRLQTNAPLTGTWGDVPGTLGASSAIVPSGTANTYFRLVGP